MFLTYDEYTTLGYNTVPPDAFDDAEFNAEVIVRKKILNRPFITETDPPSYYNENDPEYWSEANKRGIARIMNLQYASDNPTTTAGGELKRVVNAEYSEEYSTSTTSKGDSSLSLEGKIQSIIDSYYTQSQLYRGVR